MSERILIQAVNNNIISPIKPAIDGFKVGSIKVIEKQITSGGPGCFGFVGRILGVHYRGPKQEIFKEFIENLTKGNK